MTYMNFFGNPAVPVDSVGSVFSRPAISASVVPVVPVTELSLSSSLSFPCYGTTSRSSA